MASRHFEGHGRAGRVQSQPAKLHFNAIIMTTSALAVVQQKGSWLKVRLSYAMIAMSINASFAQLCQNEL